MPERTIDTGFWNDPFVQPKSFNAKALYLYAWTNEHCNPAGLYEITMLTMTRETGLDEQSITAALAELDPHVVWYPEYNLLWVRPFVNRQSRSSKFYTAAGKCLKTIRDTELIEEYIRYQWDHYKIPIPYPYPIDTLSIPSAREADQKDSGSGSYSYSISNKDKRGSGGEKEKAEAGDRKMAVIAKLYEENIGMITPGIADRLKWIRDTFPDGWFEAAVQEALEHNARSLAYITSILERWGREGFKAGKKNPPGKRSARNKNIPEGVIIDE